MTTYDCWKCKQSHELHQGRISQKGNFTCFLCLRNWTVSMKPVWRKQAEAEEKELQKRPINQMSFFELHENLNTVFH